jgi:hypothetical protein
MWLQFLLPSAGIVRNAVSTMDRREARVSAERSAPSSSRAIASGDPTDEHSKSVGGAARRHVPPVKSLYSPASSPTLKTLTNPPQ